MCNTVLQRKCMCVLHSVYTGECCTVYCIHYSPSAVNYYEQYCTSLYESGRGGPLKGNRVIDECTKSTSSRILDIRVYILQKLDCTVLYLQHVIAKPTQITLHVQCFISTCTCTVHNCTRVLALAITITSKNAATKFNNFLS